MVLLKTIFPCQSIKQSGTWLFYLVELLLVLGMCLLLKHMIYQKCNQEVPQCVKKMMEHTKAPFMISEASTDQWQAVTSSADVYVYSAYFEKNFNDRIRMIGAIVSQPTIAYDLYCIMFFDDVAKTLSIVKASAVYINEGHFKRLTAAYFVCPLLGRSVPAFVSLADRSHVHSPLNLKMIHSQLEQSPRYDMTACISPMYDNSDDDSTEQLVEWIETNKALGVQLFTAYIHNISVSHLAVLKYYESLEILEILNWTLSDDVSGKSNKPSTGDIHYVGQIAALNDCLYRNKGRSSFTAAIDLDELIVPHMTKDFTLMDMLQRVPSAGAYMFRHSYFNTIDYSRHSKTKEYSFDIRFINNYQRDNQIKEVTDRSKMIFKADAVVTVGIHNAWSLIESFVGYEVDPDIGMLHHYKTNDAANAVVTDRATEKYINKVIENMNRTINAI